MPRASATVENFLRRWATVDITPENAFLFDEHLMGISALASKKDQAFLAGLTRHTPRLEFANRYRKLLNE